MTKSVPKLVLSGSRDIPFNRLVLSQSNVRRVKAGISIPELGGYGEVTEVTVTVHLIPIAICNQWRKMGYWR
jgi:hypothetical protein